MSGWHGPDRYGAPRQSPFLHHAVVESRLPEFVEIGEDLTKNLVPVHAHLIGEHRSPAAPVRLERIHKTIPKIFHAVKIDRKSTRLNSSHLVISYAVFCLK